MKHSLKHKLYLGMGSMLFIVSVLVSFVPVSTSALKQSDCPSGTYLNKSDDTICCPKGQSPAQVHGQGVERSCCPTTQAFQQAKNDGEVAKACLFGKYINPLINLLSAIVGVVVVIGIIVGAIQFSSSAGDPQKAANGKNHIRNALLGLLAYIMLYAFLQFIIPGGTIN